MAHWEQLEFVRRVREHLPQYFEDVNVLEVGSGEIGHTIRPLFLRGRYLGVDVSPGPSVDRVCPGQELDEPSASFDVVVSCECFEHNPFWVETFSNMLRMLKPGGLCVVSCAFTGRTEHGTQRMDPGASLAESAVYKAYYRNLRAADFENKWDLDLHFSAWFFRQNIFHKDLYFVGIKRDQSSFANADQWRALRLSVSTIRREWALGPGDAALAYVKHALKVVFIAIFGERRLHDFKFNLRGRVRALGKRALGNDRYVERSARRREKHGQRRAAASRESPE